MKIDYVILIVKNHLKSKSITHVYVEYILEPMVDDILYRQLTLSCHHHRQSILLNVKLYYDLQENKIQTIL